MSIEKRYFHIRLEQSLVSFVDLWIGTTLDIKR